MPNRLRTAFILLTIVGLALPVGIIWSVEYPPLVDAPNHLARHYLESLHLRGKPLPHGYEVDYRILPNLGADLIIPFLICVFAPLTALKIFLTLSVILYWLGPAWFIGQETRWSTSGLLALLMYLPYVLSNTFFWGFLNYYSGVGLAFLAAAHLRRLERQTQIHIVEYLFHILLVTLLFFWHLAIVFTYGLLAGSLILWSSWQRFRQGERFVGKAFYLGAPLIPALVLIAVYITSRKEAPPPDDWGDVMDKFRNFITPFTSYNDVFDRVIAGLWLAVIPICFVAPWRGKPTWSLLSLLVVTVAFLIIPTQWGSTNQADKRLAPVIVICVLGCLGALPTRRLLLGALLIGLTIVLRNGFIFIIWQQSVTSLQRAANSLAVLNKNTAVVPVMVPVINSIHRPEIHFACYATITKKCHVPTLFAYDDQQPLIVRDFLPPDVDYDEFMTSKELINTYDYIWIYNVEAAVLKLPSQLHRIFQEGPISVYQVQK